MTDEHARRVAADCAAVWSAEGWEAAEVLAVSVCWVVHPIHDGRKTQRGTATVDAATEPSPCVTADGLGAAPRHRAWLERTVRIPQSAGSSSSSSPPPTTPGG